ncbi:MAG: hypothetical protein NTX64_16860 [Elusimicrobia bacterium]|nr:hypothetical protein [Elusimicrobiota bacterium]
MSRRTIAFACLILAALAAPGPTSVGYGQEGLPPFPDMAQFRAQLAQAPAAPEIRRISDSFPVPTQALPAPELPATFSICERFFAFTDTFDIKADGATLGTIRERLISFTKSFTYTDAGKNKVAEARARFFALGATVDVTDGAGRKIGTIKEDILKSLFKVYTQYQILDAAGKPIATSEKVEWLSTEIVLRDPAGRVVAEVRRGFKENLLRLTDRWDVSIRAPKAIDSRLVVMIAAYKSSVDNDRRKEQSRKSSDDDK